jgi:hypothetical protein
MRTASAVVTRMSGPSPPQLLAQRDHVRVVVEAPACQQGCRRGLTGGRRDGARLALALWTSAFSG